MEQNGRQLTVREIYDITERNYNWEQFKYVLPRKYANHQQSKGIDGGVFGTKDNYLDQLQKEKKKIPGPTHYKNQGIISRPKSGKMDKKQRLTYSDEVKFLSNKENIPGPGAYFKRPQTAVPTGINSKRQAPKPRNHYLNEVQFLAITSPGVGEYNLGANCHVSSPKILLKSSKSRKQLKQNKVKLMDTMYCIDGTFASIKKKVKKRSSNLPRSERFVTESKFEKKPGPNSYTLNQNWSKSNSLMKTTCKKMSAFSGNVYYN